MPKSCFEATFSMRLSLMLWSTEGVDLKYRNQVPSPGGHLFWSYGFTYCSSVTRYLSINSQDIIVMFPLTIECFLTLM